MGQLLVVRHGQSTWNAAGRWQGWADPPLTSLGQDQARSAGRALAAAGEAFALVASSDLRRARRTAQLIAQEIGYRGPVVTDPDLREQDMGHWSGLNHQQIEHRWPGLLAERRSGRIMSVPGGEDGAEFERRCLAAFRRLLARREQPVIAVSHGGAMVALERALGIGPQPAGHANLTGWLVSDEGGELVALRRVELASAHHHPQPGQSHQPGQRQARPRLSYGAVDGAQ